MVLHRYNDILINLMTYGLLVLKIFLEFGVFPYLSGNLLVYMYYFVLIVWKNIMLLHEFTQNVFKIYY